MGRHAAGWVGPGSPDPEDGGIPAGPGRPRHSDLFKSTPGASAAEADRTARAFDQLIDPHRLDLDAYVSRLTDGDESATQSIVKETLYRMARDWGRYAHHPAAVRPRLILTALHVVRNGERHAPAGHDDRPPSFQPSDGPPAETMASVPPATVVAALAALPADQRELIVGLFPEGGSVNSWAESRGVPVDTVKYELFVAMRALRAAIEASTPERPTDDQ